jgi:hypothetical protein
MGRGVECKACGASTPLPDDLRIPTFSCAFCHAQLQTVAYVGETAQAADEMRAFFQRVVHSPDAIGTAPRLPTANRDETRPGKCRRCGGAIAISLDLRVHQVTCGACGHVDPINAHVSDAERLQLDMARQIAGNQSLKQLRAEGVACDRCGGTNPVPDDGSVQIICRQCGQPILLADHVDKDALARSRLKHAAMELRAGIQERQQNAQKKESRIVAIVLLAVFGCVGVGIAISLLLSTR